MAQPHQTALKEFKTDVENQSFPTADHGYVIK